MTEERELTLSELGGMALRAGSVEDCREVIRLLNEYWCAHPGDHEATDVAYILSKVIDANGWNAEFPD